MLFFFLNDLCFSHPSRSFLAQRCSITLPNNSKSQLEDASLTCPSFFCLLWRWRGEKVVEFTIWLLCCWNTGPRSASFWQNPFLPWAGKRSSTFSPFSLYRHVGSDFFFFHLSFWGGGRVYASSLPREKKKKNSEKKLSLSFPLSGARSWETKDAERREKAPTLEARCSWRRKKMCPFFFFRLMFFFFFSVLRFFFCFLFVELLNDTVLSFCFILFFYLVHMSALFFFSIFFFFNFSSLLFRSDVYDGIGHN